MPPDTPPTMPADFEDPCAAYTDLRKAYLALIQGQQEAEVEYQQLGANRRVLFVKADIGRLENEMNAAKSACAAIVGVPDTQRRFAISGGSSFDRYRGGY
jgi:hypothetical protein